MPAGSYVPFPRVIGDTASTRQKLQKMAAQRETANEVLTMIRMAPGYLIQQAKDLAREANMISAETKVWNETQRGCEMSPVLLRTIIDSGDERGFVMRRSFVSDEEVTVHGRFQCTVTSTITIHKF